MQTIEFLEKIASQPHYSLEILSLIKIQPLSVQEALLSNDSEIFKKLFPYQAYSANTCMIIQA